MATHPEGYMSDPNDSGDDDPEHMSPPADEKTGLINHSSLNALYGDPSRAPKLKEIASDHRDSSSSVDVELSTSPPKKQASLLYKVVLMVILVLSGAAMTLCMKNQDQFCLEHCPTVNGTDHPLLLLNDTEPVEPHYFHQPFIQLFHLGFGQLISGVFTPFFNADAAGLVPITFRQFMPQAALASLFDVCAEVLIIIGLSLTFASVTEMLKTTMVVFVGLLSLYFFPGFTINWKQWIASGFMLAGSLLVILQSFISGDEGRNTGEEVGGACLVIAAQLFYGLEFVVEEKLIDHSKLKGIHVNKAKLVFSLGILSMTGAIILQMPWTAIMSDFPTLAKELGIYFTEPQLWASGIGISVGVMGFDLAGLGISEVMGSDRRAISVAAFQVTIVWTISILLKWEAFSYYSLAGFLVILASGAVYVLTSKSKAEPHQERKKKQKMKNTA